MRKKTSTRIEDLFYKRVLRPLLFTSRLGRRSMFGYADSGINFDYIYRNKPNGYTRFGSIIDRLLLNLPAARATRERKTTTIRQLTRELKQNLSLGIRTRIVDLASGPSRYLVELLEDQEMRRNVEALCLDTDRKSLKYGTGLAEGKPILYRRIDAFRIDKLRNLSQLKAWKPNVVLASGLYEYKTDEIVKASLSAILRSMDAGGLLLFFCQASNPSKKLLEKLGRTRAGTPWVLFYRKPQVIKDWMENVGFQDINVSTDRWNMYLTCLGRKPD